MTLLTIDKLTPSVGAEVLASGGNAVDAAIAAALALCALEPWMSGLGGGGFMVIAKGDGAAPEVIDFGLVAPSGLDIAAYPLVEGRDDDLFGWPAVLGDRNLHGPLAVAVPGLLDALRVAHERWGSLPFRELVVPAVALAERHGINPKTVAKWKKRAIIVSTGPALASHWRDRQPRMQAARGRQMRLRNRPAAGPNEVASAFPEGSVVASPESGPV